MASKVGTSPWSKEGDDKRAFVQGMFADVAPSYDLVNSLMCFRLHHRWRKAAVAGLGLKQGEGALDVCCGTGDFLTPLRQAIGECGQLLGVDFCAPMLERAKGKRTGAELAIGDACALPVADESVDGVSVGWGLRNVPDIGAALREAHRVLRPGGRFVTLDMARPRSRIIGKASEWVFHTVVPLIGRVFGKSQAYTYLPQSTLRFLSREEMKAAIEAAGFTEVRWKDAFFGNVCMHWGVKR